MFSIDGTEAVQMENVGDRRLKSIRKSKAIIDLQKPGQVPSCLKRGRLAVPAEEGWWQEG